MSKSGKPVELNRVMQELSEHLRSQCVHLDDHRWHEVCIIEWLNRRNSFDPVLCKIYNKNAFPELIEFLAELGKCGFLNIFI